MRDPIPLKVSKWPFVAGDVALFATACFICKQSQWPMGHWELAFTFLSVLAAAICGLVPFVFEYKAAVKAAETGALTTAIAQIQQLENLAAQIGGATAQWQTVHEEAGRTTTAAREIAERMTAEVRRFAEFMERANSSEKATLRLEVDKLRRAEADWLEVLVRMLDHVFALHQGAVRSGQPNLIGQLSRFQNACCDAARRIGLAPFIAAPAEPFDPKRHQLLEGENKPSADAVVGDTLATGYTFQGKLLRPALVRLRDDGASPSVTAAGPQMDDPTPAQIPPSTDAPSQSPP